MLTIRLSRFGKKKQPEYRLIINEKTKDPWGTYMENLGYYNPRAHKAELKVERIKYWLGQGAQTSDTVWNLFVANGIVEGKKKTATKLSKKRRGKIEEEVAAKKAADAEAQAAKEAEEVAKAEAAAKAEEAKAAEAAAETPAPAESAPEAPKAEEAVPAEEQKTEEKTEEKAEEKSE